MRSKPPRSRNRPRRENDYRSGLKIPAIIPAPAEFVVMSFRVFSGMGMEHRFIANFAYLPTFPSLSISLLLPMPGFGIMLRLILAGRTRRFEDHLGNRHLTTRVTRK